MSFRVTVEASNPPLKVVFGLLDNGVNMIPRIAVDIQVNILGPKHSHTTTTTSTGDNKAICKSNPVFNFLHLLYFRLCLHEEDNLRLPATHHIVQCSD